MLVWSSFAQCRSLIFYKMKAFHGLKKTPEHYLLGLMDRQISTSKVLVVRVINNASTSFSWGVKKICPVTFTFLAKGLKIVKKFNLVPYLVQFWSKIQKQCHRMRILRKIGLKLSNVKKYGTKLMIFFNYLWDLLRKRQIMGQKSFKLNISHTYV